MKKGAAAAAPYSVVVVILKFRLNQSVRVVLSLVYDADLVGVGV